MNGKHASIFLWTKSRGLAETRFTLLSYDSIPERHYFLSLFKKIYGFVRFEEMFECLEILLLVTGATALLYVEGWLQYAMNGLRRPEPSQNYEIWTCRKQEWKLNPLRVGNRYDVYGSAINYWFLDQRDSSVVLRNDHTEAHIERFGQLILSIILIINRKYSSILYVYYYQYYTTPIILYILYE